VKPSGIITLLTDFGTDDAFVGIMKGVVLGINRQARLVDLSHAVPPQQLLAGSLLLRSAVGYFADGTVHVAVVDPGVGSERRALVIETERAWLIGPDNGILSLAARFLGVRDIHQIANCELLRQPVSQTFHGRDVFAPVAAHVSRGISLETVGPSVEAVAEIDVPRPRRLDGGVNGEVIYVDHFGNLVTNIDAECVASFPARPLSVSIQGTLIAGPVPAYTSVTEGTPLSIVGSWGMLEIAVRGGNAAARLAAGPGTPVAVVWE
jgi:S-adenosyl-L-methionine hydrolase (adenosine-forming)